jgi:hypothetical protein
MTRPSTAASRLRAALEATATALARPRLEALLSAEAALSAAIAELPTILTLDADERQSARDELFVAKAALLRCRRLGSALSGFVRLSLDARGQGIGYESDHGTALALSGRGLETRA